MTPHEVKLCIHNGPSCSTALRQNKPSHSHLCSVSIPVLCSGSQKCWQPGLRGGREMQAAIPARRHCPRGGGGSQFHAGDFQPSSFHGNHPAWPGGCMKSPQQSWTGKPVHSDSLCQERAHLHPSVKTWWEKQSRVRTDRAPGQGRGQGASPMCQGPWQDLLTHGARSQAAPCMGATLGCSSVAVELLEPLVLLPLPCQDTAPTPGSRVSGAGRKPREPAVASSSKDGAVQHGGQQCLTPSGLPSPTGHPDPKAGFGQR